MMKTLALIRTRLSTPPICRSSSTAPLPCCFPAAGPSISKFPTVMALKIEGRPGKAGGGDPPALRQRNVQRAAILCAEAVRPVILCGGGALTGSGTCRDFAERIGAPVVTTVTPAACLPAIAPGTASPEPQGDTAELLREADLVLALATKWARPITISTRMAAFRC